MMGGRLKGRMLACADLLCLRRTFGGSGPAPSPPPPDDPRTASARHDEGGVRLVGAVEQREADDERTSLTCGICFSSASTCLRTLAGAGHRGTVRQLDLDEERALVLLGQEAGRGQPRETEDAGAEHQHRRRPTSPPTAGAAARCRHSRRAPGRCLRARVPRCPRRGPVCAESTAQSAGDSVSALTAEISMATLIVTANWRNSCPRCRG